MKTAAPIRSVRLAMPILALSGVVGICHAMGLLQARERVPVGPPVARVERVDPRDRFVMTAAGRINSARNTLIECEIENISGSGLSSGRGGSRSRGSSGLKLISVVPEGSQVTSGQVLAEIDPSQFVEIVRLQQIRVEQSRADEARARLDLEAAEISLSEYLDGTRPQTVMQLEGQISLAKSQLQQQRDHLAWTNRVLPLGYVALSAVTDELIAMLQAEQALVRAELSLKNYESYTQPKMVRQLESRLEQARANHLFAERRRQMDEERLAVAERQLDRCTIRAPHDGQVIYCSTRDGSPIRVGLDVYRGMDLFILPDLDRPVVDAQVNQTHIWMIREGLDARVRVDARPGPVLRGRVTSVSPFPDSKDTVSLAAGVMTYNVRVELEPGERLMPGYSARVDLLVPAVPDAMTIPSEALSVIDEETVCFVLAPSGVERRVVVARPGSVDRLQVVEGLAEGEEVILGPQHADPDLEWMATGRTPERVDDA